MINDDSKNKKLIETLIQKYRIQRLIISVVHSQVNEITKRKHISIKNAFSKLTLKDEKKWIRHSYLKLWANRTIIKRFIDIIFLRIIIETKEILFIKLNISIWQILFWEKIHTIVDFLILRAKQIQRKNENLKKTIMHLIDWFIHLSLWHRICRSHASLSVSVYIQENPSERKKLIFFVSYRLLFEAF